MTLNKVVTIKRKKAEIFFYIQQLKKILQIKLQNLLLL